MISTVDASDRRRKYQNLRIEAAVLVALGCGSVTTGASGTDGHDAAAGTAGELGGRGGAAGAGASDAAAPAVDSRGERESEASETSDAATLPDGRCRGCISGGRCIVPDDVTTCGRNGEACQAVQSPLVCGGTQGGCGQGQEAATRRACDYTSGATSIRVYQVCCPANVCDVAECEPCVMAGQPCPS